MKRNILIVSFLCMSSLIYSSDTLTHLNEQLHSAVRLGNIDEVKRLLDAGANVNSKDNNCTPLHYAVESNNLEMASLLLKEGANVNSRDGQKSTPLLHNAVENNNLEMASLLLKAGANVNSKGYSEDSYQRTPLHYAVERSNFEMASLLLKEGANVNSEDRYQCTPLHYAVKNNNLEMVFLLFKAGANVNSRDRGGVTPLALAASLHVNPKIISLLLDFGADVQNQEKRISIIPLARAISSNQLDVAKAIVQDGFLRGQYSLQDVEEKIAQYPQLGLDLSQLYEYVSTVVTQIAESSD